MRIAGVIFNGGKALRLGGIDKGAIVIDGVTTFDRVAASMSAVDSLFVSVAADYPGDDYNGVSVIKDNPDLLPIEGRPPGVMLSVLTCLTRLSEQGFDAALSAPVDTPYLPVDYSERMTAIGAGAPAVAVTGGDIHGLHALWPANTLPTLQAEALAGLRRISKLHDVLGSKPLEFNGSEMRNLNAPADILGDVD